MENFEKRLAALEKSNVRYRIILACAFAALLYFIITSFSPKNQVPDVIQAKKFELIDDHGAVLVRLENYKGNGSVTTFKPDGNTLTDIVATKSNAGGIVVYDGNGNKNLTITDVTGGGGSFIINNSQGQKVVSIGRNTKDAGSITLYNNINNQIALITSDTNSDGVALVYNSGGNQTGRMPN
jgi:hypothetical protein